MSPLNRSITDVATTTKESGMSQAGSLRLGQRAVAALLTLALGAFACLLLAASASAAVSLTLVDGGAFKSGGEAETQAGSHPASAWTEFRLSQEPKMIGSQLKEVSTETIKDVIVELPAGLVGNPQAVESCTIEQMNTNSGEGCPLDSQVGVVTLRTNGQEGSPGAPGLFLLPLFNIKAPFGTAALLGFVIKPTPVYVSAGLRSDGDYGITATSLNAPVTKPLEGVKAEIWGVPADPSHDDERSPCLGGGGNKLPGCSVPHPDAADPKAFMTLPTSCTGSPVSTEITVKTWEDGEAAGSFDSPATTGCDSVPFEPSLKARPTTGQAAGQSGLDVDLHLPQDQIDDPGELATAHLRDTTVELPEGLVLSPSGANGLAACSMEQAGVTSSPGEAPVRFDGQSPECPDTSKLATVEVNTPLLGHALPGSVYLAEPFDNPFDSLIALYIAIDDPRSGVVVKVAAEVKVDKATGRLSATVRENPQLPFEDFRLRFFDGTSGSLSTPDTCGTYSTASTLTPWTAPDSGPPALHEDSFEIAGACAPTKAQRPFRVGLSAGAASPLAGAHSPFSVRLTREDGDQELNTVEMAMPPGFTAALKGVATCTDAQLGQALARSNPGDGQAEIAGPSCPAQSQIGTTTVGAGTGPEPFYVKTGKAYLTGPYKGAPLSVSFVVPAVAGPFDLGVQVVRTALHVDPKTAQITAKSDPIPQMLEGIPLQVKDVRIEIDRPGFALNPTNCEAMQIVASATGGSGAVANLSNRFQVGDCAALGFEPRTNVRLFGGIARGKYQGVRAVVRPRPGDANISRTVVRFPRSAFVAQEHLKDICTRVQYAADACPKRSVYGRAIAYSPLLDEPLRGNVYLRSSDNALPDLVADLRGPAHQPIRIEVAVRNDSVKGALRNTVQAVPDAPVSYFRLQTFGKSKGLIVNSRNICRGRNLARVAMAAHNGRRSVQNVNVFNKRCKAYKRKLRKNKRRAKAKRSAHRSRAAR